MSKFNFTWWEKQLENTDSKGKARLRFRNFTTIVYPDSAPEDWIARLDEYCVPYIISPLHDRDKNMVGNTPKKPHYHVMIMFDNVKSLEQVKEIFTDINAVGGEIVQSPRGTARYLCHLDNPEKARYSVTDVRCGFGADYDSLCTLNSDLRTTTRLMQDVIRQHDFVYLEDFADWCMDNNEEFYKVLTEKRTYYIGQYIASRRRRKLDKNLKI